MLVVIFPALTHSQKPFITASQSISVGFVITTFWQKYLFAMHLLNAMSQHRPIHFFQNIFPNMYLVIRANPHYVTIKGGMVNLAKRQSVGGYSKTIGMAIRGDVSSIEELPVLKRTDRALITVGMEHIFTEGGLM